jgi:hypothetical protein
VAGNTARSSILARLPEEHPWGFDLLPVEEQEWRARLFLAVWIQTSGLAFAWFSALAKHEDDAQRKAWVLDNFTDEVIIDGLQSRQTPEPTT